MATEQDTSTPEATLRPQTPAARRRNPEEPHARTQQERDRLREESRARRKARAEGRVVAPEPPAEEIHLRRLSEAEREAAPPRAKPSVPPPAPPAPAPRAKPSVPPPSTPAAGRFAPRPAPEALEPPPTEAPREEAPEWDAPTSEPAPPRRASASRDVVPWYERVRDVLFGDFAREPRQPETAAASASDAPPPRPPLSWPKLPSLDDLPALPKLRSLPDEQKQRWLALLGIASALGILVALAATLGSSGFPGFSSDFRAESTARAVAPGGWLTVKGEHGEGGSKVILESRGHGENWHSFGEGQTDDKGAFSVRGRILERPGKVQVRARIPGAATAAAIPVVVRPLRLAAVGDINLDGAPTGAYGSVGRALKSADLSFGNLETVVSNRGEPFEKEYNFRAKPAALAGLARATGIDALNLANNHTGDYGAEGLLDTIGAVKRNGIQPIGAGRNLRQALQPRVVKRLGLRVAFVGFSEIAPIEFSAGADRPGTAWANPSEIVAAVRAARRKADIVIATFHWGIELQTLETQRQRDLADVAVKAGAQIVIGAHPHTLEPVRRQGGALVAYSLGNFVFDAHSPDTTSTGILRLDLGAEGVTRASWRPARIAGGRPLLSKEHPRRIPLRDSLQMQAGVNLPQL